MALNDWPLMLRAGVITPYPLSCLTWRRGVGIVIINSGARGCSRAQKAYNRCAAVAGQHAHRRGGMSIGALNMLPARRVYFY